MQEPEPSQATGMALVRCILGKFLGVVCHCFPPKYMRGNKYHKLLSERLVLKLRFELRNGSYYIIFEVKNEWSFTVYPHYIFLTPLGEHHHSNVGLIYSGTD